MLDRRAFLLSGLAVYGVSGHRLFAAAPALQNPRFPASPFTLGVASGDPTPMESCCGPGLRSIR